MQWNDRGTKWGGILPNNNNNNSNSNPYPLSSSTVRSTKQSFTPLHSQSSDYSPRTKTNLFSLSAPRSLCISPRPACVNPRMALTRSSSPRRITWPNHRSRYFVILSLISVTSKQSAKYSFLILSCRETTLLHTYTGACAFPLSVSAVCVSS